MCPKAVNHHVLRPAAPWTPTHWISKLSDPGPQTPKPKDKGPWTTWRGRQRIQEMRYLLKIFQSFQEKFKNGRSCICSRLFLPSHKLVPRPQGCSLSTSPKNSNSKLGRHAKLNLQSRVWHQMLFPATFFNNFFHFFSSAFHIGPGWNFSIFSSFFLFSSSLPYWSEVTYRFGSVTHDPEEKWFTECRHLYYYQKQPSYPQ